MKIDCKQKEEQSKETDKETLRPFTSGSDRTPQPLKFTHSVKGCDYGKNGD